MADIICSSDIINIFIRQKGSGKMQIAICDDEVSMVQILEEKIKKLLPDAVIDKYLSGDELIASGSKLFLKGHYGQIPVQNALLP